MTCALGRYRDDDNRERIAGTPAALAVQQGGTVADSAASIETKIAASAGAVPAGLLAWLIERVAYYVECETTDIDADAPLADYGLDSVYAFALCGDIEDELQLPVEPTVVWDFGTVSALAAHLSGLEPAAAEPRS
jgi:acyl carrier protein